MPFETKEDMLGSTRNLRIPHIECFFICNDLESYSCIDFLKIPVIFHMNASYSSTFRHVC